MLSIRFLLDHFIYRSDVKLVSNVDHPLVPAHELLLKAVPKFIDALFDLSCDLLLMERHVWEKLADLRLADLV